MIIKYQQETFVLSFETDDATVAEALNSLSESAKALPELVEVAKSALPLVATAVANPEVVGFVLSLVGSSMFTPANDNVDDFYSDEGNDPNLVEHLAALMQEVDAMSWPSALVDYSYEEFVVSDEQMSEWIHVLDDIRRAA